jgi:hypothetical protein
MLPDIGTNAIVCVGHGNIPHAMIQIAKHASMTAPSTNRVMMALSVTAL